MRGRLALALIALNACAGGGAGTAPSTRAETLVDRLRRAAADRTPIGAVEAAVGERAILLTDREGDRGALSIVDLSHDELSTDCGDAGDLTTYAGAGYWARGSDDNHGNPRMVGLRWLESGAVEVFCAVVLPP